MAHFDQGWVVLFASCCILGLTLWTGVNAMTVKLMILWTFIFFGFVTLVLHAFGSSLNKLLAWIRSSDDDGSTVCSEEELIQRRQQAMTKKQVVQDDKTQYFQETVLQPRKVAQVERKNSDFYRFGKLWRGPGYKLKNVSGESYVPHEDLPVSGSAEDEQVIYENSDSRAAEASTEDKVAGETTSRECLRQRHKQAKTDNYDKQVTNSLPTEPHLGSVGAITVAFRCPNGQVKKRRFTQESQIQVLVTYATCLGFPPSHYVIRKTYPRDSLSDVTQTFVEAGFTHDVALVIEEL